MPKDMNISVLLDFYGEILTDKQRSMVEHYYNNDLSLGEIAENENISRQGVRDSVKRAEAQLIEVESKLGYLKKYFENQTTINDIKLLAEELLIFNKSHTTSLQLEEIGNNIITLVEKLA